jgi:hypothetical protein
VAQLQRLKKDYMTEVIEVQNFQECCLGKERSAKVKSFSSISSDGCDKINTFEAYGGAGDQRRSGAMEASKVGAIQCDYTFIE